MANRKPKPEKALVDLHSLMELGRAQARADAFVGIRNYSSKYVRPTRTYTGVEVQQLFELLADAIRDRRL